MPHDGGVLGCGVEQLGQLGWLITIRSWVQIPLPLPKPPPMCVHALIRRWPLVRIQPGISMPVAQLVRAPSSFCTFDLGLDSHFEVDLSEAALKL